jgi:glycosyltransferase involved in cell wall biosynthesis
MTVTYGLSFIQLAARVRQAGSNTLKTYVSEYNVYQPLLPITGLAGYSQLLLLIRRRCRPLGLLLLSHNPAESCVSTEELQVELEKSGIAERFTDTPDAEDINPDLPPISVVVCTRDRPAALQRCLTALMRLDYGTFEVIVVDNASVSVETEQIVARTPFHYVREDIPGLDWARNRGVVEASYDIIAYTDDDVTVDRHWLRSISRVLSDPAVIAVTGLVLPAELETPAQHYFQSYGNGMCKGLEPKFFHREKMSAAELLAAQDLGVGANMAFRKDILERLGGFDTALDVGTPAAGGGDLDMFHRIIMTEEVLAYSPDVLVWHQHRIDMSGLKRQLYGHGRAYGVYLIKRWREGRLSRRQILRFALLRWIFWLAGRLILGLCGRHWLPLPLLWTEAWGALHAPLAYISSRLRDRGIRDKYKNY